MVTTKPRRDWAERRAERFYLTHTKFCQGDNATQELTERWITALAAAFRGAYNSGFKFGKKVCKR